MKRYLFLLMLLGMVAPLSYTKPIVLFFAMDSEADDFLSFYKIKSCNQLLDDRLQLNCYALNEKGKENVYVVTNKMNKSKIFRVATQPAAVAAWEIINKFNPEWIINAGTAGGYKNKGAKVGSVYVCDKFAAYHDRRIPLGEAWEVYGRGYFPCADLDKISEIIHVNQGNISTGNSLDLSNADEQEISILNASVKDMEAAAIADVANLADVKFTAIKSITDLVDKDADTSLEFDKNFHIATENLAIKTNLLIAELIKHNT